MTVVSAIVIFAVTWFLALFCLLPIGIRSQEEADEDVPEGAMPGAPSNPNMKAKAIGATLISAAITALLVYLIGQRILTLDVIDGWFGIQ